MAGPEEIGWVLLFHIDPPYKHAKHVYDWMRSGDQVKYPDMAVVRAARQAGSKFKLDRRWAGTRSDMLHARGAGNASKMCRTCRKLKKLRWQDEHMEQLLQESIERSGK